MRTCSESAMSVRIQCPLQGYAQQICSGAVLVQVQGPIFASAGQIGIIVRISSVDHTAPGPPVKSLFLWRLERPPCCRFVMIEHRERCVDDEKTALPQPETEIYVVVCHLESLIESADLLEHSTADHQASRGYGAAIPDDVGEVVIARFVRPLESEGVAGSPENAQHDPGMLNAPVRIQQ